MSKRPEDEDSKVKMYMHYSGMAFELVAILFIAVFAGQKLDAWAGNETPYFVLGLLMLFLVAYFIRIYYTLIK